MIYSFIFLPFCPDPDPGRSKTCGSCGSGSETLILSEYLHNKFHFSNNLLLVDEDDDGWVDAGVEDGDEFVPLVVLVHHVHNLNKQKNGYS